MKETGIFEVDIKGLRQLQAGKPKWFVMRELIQNALDEPITECKIKMEYKKGRAHIFVEDDSPIGFRNLADAYTLFKDTYKRSDVRKRGRFNFGEKQLICLCDEAEIISTTGGYKFNNDGRTRLRRKRERGSQVFVVLKMSVIEYNECVNYINSIHIPLDIKLTLDATTVGGCNEKKELVYKQPYISFSANLKTELSEDGILKTTRKNTVVYLYKPTHFEYSKDTAYIYELGIPICEIDCDYDIDVQQKVPLSTDRDKVDGKYLKELYGEVLNYTHTEIEKEKSSQLWIREAITSNRVEKATVKDIVEKRFGDKSVIANPFDRRSIDEAISRNYNVVYGSEMSKDEWNKIKEFNIMKSSSEVFGSDYVDAEVHIPNEMQLKIGRFAQKIASEFFGLTLKIEFLKSPKATVQADFGGNTLRFNVSKIPSHYWETYNGYIGTNMLNLLIHELGHSKGMHYEHSYHECLTKLGSVLTIKALESPEWFKL